MQSSVAHILALAAHGRAVLRSTQKITVPARLDPPEFAEVIQFNHLYERDGAIERDAVADSVSHWIEHLHRTGHTCLDVYYLPGGQAVPDWQTAAFVGGGGSWLLGATSAAGVDYWRSNWSIAPQPEADAGIWQIEYVRVIRSDRGKRPVTSSLADCRAALYSALTTIKAFSASNRLKHYESVFDQALGILHGSIASPVGALSDSHLPEHALRLAAAAEKAWVFGGMLSWNDQGFEGPEQDQFIEVTARLYTCACSALVSAANTADVKRWWQVWR